MLLYYSCGDYMFDLGQGDRALVEVGDLLEVMIT